MPIRKGNDLHEELEAMMAALDEPPALSRQADLARHALVAHRRCTLVRGHNVRAETAVLVVRAAFLYTGQNLLLFCPRFTLSSVGGDPWVVASPQALPYLPPESVVIISGRVNMPEGVLQRFAYVWYTDTRPGEEGLWVEPA